MPFNDDYGIEEQYQQMRKLLQEIEVDVYKFIGPSKNKEASIRVRSRLQGMRDLSVTLRASIVKQRQDNGSNY